MVLTGTVMFVDVCIALSAGHMILHFKVITFVILHTSSTHLDFVSNQNMGERAKLVITGFVISALLWAMDTIGQKPDQSCQRLTFE